MQQLIEYIERFVKLNSEAIKELEKRTELESYTKNRHIIEAGQRCNKLWFLKKGMVRKYQIWDGKEITAWIHVENEMFTSLQSYAQNIPADEYLQACEETEVISITKTNSEKLARFTEFMIFSNALMEREFVNIDIHTKALNQRNARGKYEYLREIAPEMTGRAKLGHIASIIGVTQETLSRIRKG
ncbi:MAG: Crp/Fnr family transcriptional regulator [Cytophagales bacterium]|nr:Crp/Fnr family transcriptional regulator [Cytophagales bacterium]